MAAPTQQQLNDPKWWDTVAPEGATHFFPPSGDWYKDAERGLECWAESLGLWFPGGFPDRLEDRLAVERPAKPEPKDAPDLFYEALGWAYAQCCAWLDDGKDPRTEDCGQLVHMAERDFGIRTQAEREIEDLQHDLMGILPFCEYTDDQIKEMAKILHTQGYRKPNADLVRKGDS